MKNRGIWGRPSTDGIFPVPTSGSCGTDYDSRAIIGLIAFSANLPEDAIYPTRFVDGDGQPLTGANRYTLHFAAGLTPPVNAFGSVTIYDPESFFVENSIQRYAISSLIPLKRNNDGSVDIFIQHDSPGSDNEPNWLPAPTGDLTSPCGSIGQKAKAHRFLMELAAPSRGQGAVAEDSRHQPFPDLSRDIVITRSDLNNCERTPFMNLTPLDIFAQVENHVDGWLVGTGLIFLVLGLLYIVLWLYFIFNAATRSDFDTTQRIIWIVVLLFLHGLGPILYLLLAGKRLA